jgi:hypothetical protein
MDSTDFFARRWPCVEPAVERKFWLKKCLRRSPRDFKYDIRDIAGNAFGEGFAAYSSDVCFGVSFEGTAMPFPFEAFESHESTEHLGLRELYDYDIWFDGLGRKDKAQTAAQEGWYRATDGFDAFDKHSNNRTLRVSFFVNVSLVQRILVDAAFPCCPFEWLLVASAETGSRSMLTYPSGSLPRTPEWPSVSKEEYATGESLDLCSDALSTNLYPHQTMALDWMRSVEQNGQVSQPLQRPNWLSSETGLVVDFSRGRLIPRDSETEFIEIASDGGVLGDEMGLGKTLVLLSLAFGETRADLRNSSSSSSFSSSSPPVATEYPPEESLLLQERLFRDSTIPTKATLIVCPSHLVYQWSEEAQKHVSKEHLGKVVTITTAPQLKSTTYRDIASASVVLVSASLLGNSNARIAWSDFLAPDLSTPSGSSLELSDASSKKPVKRAPRKKKGEAPPNEITTSETASGAKRKRSETRGNANKVVSFESSAWKSLRCGKMREFKRETHWADKLVSHWMLTLEEFRKRVAALRAEGRPDDAVLLEERLLSSASPNLLHFGWRRVVVDEAHEFLEDPHVFQILTFVAARNRWLVSGTPGGLLGRWRQTTRFLNFRPDYKQSKAFFKSRGIPDYDRDVRRKAVFKAFTNWFYWRNTKDSAAKISEANSQNASFGAGIDVRTVSVRLSPVEIAIYRQACAESAGVQRLVQICCHPQVSNHERNIVGTEELSMELIRRKLVEHHSGGVRFSDELLRDLRRRLEEEEQAMQLMTDLERNLVEEAHPRQRELLLNAIETRRTNAEKLRGAATLEAQRRAQIESTLKFLKTVGEDSGDQECPICYGDSGAPQAILRVCGHTACSDCLRSAISIQKRCPTCRASTHAHTVEANFWVVAGKVQAPKPLDELTSKVGSKVARLISLLQEIRAESTPEAPNRAIVFSQFDSMLHKVGDLLRQHGVKTVYAKGNVHSKTCSIRKFKTDPEIAALLLSVDHCASGTNLQVTK